MANMDWDLVGRFLQRILDMWPYVLFTLVVFVAVAGILDWYRESKYFKTPWERREAKEAKKRAREEERAQKAFWEGR